MAQTAKTRVSPLNVLVPIVGSDGKPTDEFMQKWEEQKTANAAIPTTAKAISALLDLLGKTVGSLLIRGATLWQALVPPSDATKFLNGAATPAFAQVKDSDLSTSDVTTNNATSAKHGFVPKLPNDATKYFDGSGAFSTPPSGGAMLPLVNGDTPGPALVTDAVGQCIGVSL